MLLGFISDSLQLNESLVVKDLERHLKKNQSVPEFAMGTTSVEVSESCSEEDMSDYQEESVGIDQRKEEIR